MKTYFIVAATLLSCSHFAAAENKAKARPSATIVNIESMQFSPKAATVSLNETIEWTNNDLVPHTVTAPGKFDSKAIAPGQSWKFRARKKGHFEYKCSFHPTMSAAFDVK